MNKKVFLTGAAALCMLTLSATEKYVNRNDFSIHKNWQHKKIMGKDYWPVMGFYPLAKDPAKLKKKTVKRSASFACTWLEYGFPMKKDVEEKYRQMGYTFSPKKYPAFTNTGWVAYSGVGLNAIPAEKGFYAVSLKDVEEFDLAAEKNIPLIISGENLFRGNIGKCLFVTGENYTVTAKEKDKFEKWKKNHPNFLGFSILSEWDNNTYILEYFYKRSWWPASVKAKKVKAGEKDKYWKQFKERWPDVETRKEWVEKRLKPYFQRAVDASFGDPANVIPLAGSVNINHLAAYWGSRLICLETSRHNLRWQGQMMFTRGAARQFNIPWGWYIAGYLSNYSSTGKRVTDSSPNDYPGGISISAIRRGYFITWLAGANIMQSEISLWTPWQKVLKGEPFKITEAGKVYKEMYEHIEKHPDRGIPYTPIALLVNYDRGCNRAGGKAFWKFPYTHADSMLDAFLACILDWSYDKVIGNGKKGVEYAMANNPYGDIFDALTPDFKDQSTFKRVLPAYKAAVLLGEYPDNGEMAAILMDFVRKGGTLLINVKHLSKSFPEDFAGLSPTGKSVSSEGYTVEKIVLQKAKVAEKDNNGNPVLTVNNYGKGKVLTSLQHYMTDYQKEKADSRRKKHPLIDKVLRRLSAETLPLKVEGDIQYGLNKTAKGWLLYLINNKGVQKFTDKVQKLDPAQKKTVRISFSGMKPDKITEIFSGKKLIPANGQVSVEVGPGDIRILEIHTSAE